MIRRKLQSHLWEKSTARLYVTVVEGTGLAPKDPNGLSDPFVKLHYGKKQLKTSVYPKTLSPKFSPKETFILEVDGSDLLVECWDKDRLSDDFMGMIPFGKVEQKFKPEIIVDEWYELRARPGKKDEVSGKLRLRFLYTVLPDKKPEKVEEDAFMYDGIEFRTGDLILYEGIGITSNVTKLLHGSPYSNIGIVLQLPNKWTKKPEFYILETTRNLELFIDAYKEVPAKGICIFRLFERIHQLYAHHIWHCPLLNPLNEAACEKLVKFLSDQHKKNPPPSIDSNVQHILESIDKNIFKSDIACDFGALELISTALRYHADLNLTPVTCAADITKQKYYGELVKIRTPAKFAPQKIPSHNPHWINLASTMTGYSAPPAYEEAVAAPSLSQSTVTRILTASDAPEN